jgi:hypothetical protein
MPDAQCVNQCVNWGVEVLRSAPTAAIGLGLPPISFKFSVGPVEAGPSQRGRRLPAGLEMCLKTANRY